MEVTPAIYLHLATVIPAFLLGIYILANTKGTKKHRLLGRIWITLMLVTSVTTFFIRTGGSFSWIHILSCVSIITIMLGVRAIRRGNVRAHRGNMLGAFSGVVIAGFFATALPGRIVFRFLFGAE